MPIIKLPFTQYRVKFYSKASSGVEAAISCYDPAVSPHNHVARLAFFNSTVPIPNNTWSNKQLELKFPVSAFSNILDVMRNEKPLYAQIDTVQLLGIVGTGAGPEGPGPDEPVGEEES